jgi:hypothetical protein
LKVYDETWGHLDVIPLRDLAPQLRKVHEAVVDNRILEALALLEPIEALIRQAGL